MANHHNILDSFDQLLSNSPKLCALLPDKLKHADGLPSLIAHIISIPQSETDKIYRLVFDMLEQYPNILDIIEKDVIATYERNFEPQGIASTLLCARGIHATIGHRVAHQAWLEGDQALALYLKSLFSQTYATDIHPAAKIGHGFWLDHGLGFVMGETSIIGNNVSIWHQVTLGSNFKNSGDQRHPIIEDGALIGAAAIILGGITIGERASIAAGAIVLEDVEPGAIYAGPKAIKKGMTKTSFLGEEK